MECREGLLLAKIWGVYTVDLLSESRVKVLSQTIGLLSILETWYANVIQGGHTSPSPYFDVLSREVRSITPPPIGRLLGSSMQFATSHRSMTR
jgi:hypothetical protein